MKKKEIALIFTACLIIIIKLVAIKSTAILLTIIEIFYYKLLQDMLNI